MLFYIKTFGCQMNIVDSQIVSSVLSQKGYKETESIDSADIILINTCSVRDNAEQTLLKKLNSISHLKKKNKIVIGILGCMAQRLKDELINNKNIDFVCGPDNYRSITEQIEKALFNEKSSCTEMIFNEHYEDISPIYNSSILAYIPISRGCNNMCTYCVVPYTRGPEKNRPIKSILDEVKKLSDKGYKEITLLGENVNLYKYNDNNKTYYFHDLLQLVADINHNIRIRFLSSHPIGFSDDLIDVISKNKNICNHIHLPLQSGSNRMLKLMNRHYTIEEYIDIVKKIKTKIDDCEISTDIITGFCDETDNDHNCTLEVIKEIKFNQIFPFIYSEREGTYAQKNMKDNIDLATKNKRLTDVINISRKITLNSNKNYLNKTYEILIEGTSKKNKNEYFGRTTNNKVVIIKDTNNKIINIGDYINVSITDCSSATLFGKIVINDIQK